MKKIIALLLAVMMVVAMTTAFAETAAPADDPNLFVIPETPAKVTEETRASTRSDIVEIDGNQYGIITGENIGIAYEAPNSSIYVLTQDYIHQADLFASFYNDPLAAAMEFVEDGTHLNIYDNVSNVDIYVDISVANWANMFPETAEMTDSEIEIIQDYFVRNGFDDATTVTFGVAGGNSYFYYDCSASDGYVYLFTSVGGYQIRIYYAASSQAQVERGLELLNGLTITAM